jgi:GNAT superfamily N-acetyltransferase
MTREGKKKSLANDKRVIREAKEADLEKIRRVVSSAIRRCVTDCDEHYNSIYSDVCVSLDWWTENKCNALLLVCRQGDSILGMAYVKEFWNFAALFVAPELHRRGIGRELVNSIIDVCRHRSPKGYLQLNSSTYAAGFYRKMGFVQTAEPVDRPGGCIPFKLIFKK